MAVVKTMNATIVTSEYTNAKGEQKKSYLTIGTLFIYDDGGMSLKLDAAPLAGQNIAFYDKQKKEDPQQQSYQQPQQQSYQQPPMQEYRNAQGQLTDPAGNLLLDQNGQPRYQ
jgi:hypothetical protein